ncbi:MAG: hypothetical protein KKD38_03050 [Candidatus Delongbacteria bacterium]|nr:hypothetical protein [Candidatus Delongbacteria bacterium]MCG2759817.1 hypothetical protein [Candidatus Delongbacteria bacterium]
MTENPTNDYICILKTGKLLEHDLASNALKEKAIPFYKQVESSSGLRLAMPAQPAMGPGTYYNILVPRPFADEAINVLKELPIEMTTEPENWHFGASEKVKTGWKIYIWIILAFIPKFPNYCNDAGALMPICA